MIPKFRAWDKKTETIQEVESISFKEKKLVIDQKSVAWFNSDYIRNFDEVELMQSTGLKDKNGVDVYQGDIIRCTSGCLHEVIWLEEYGGTFIGGMPAWYLSGLRNGYSWTGREEVIGNIYENSELLEEQR
ncbi:DNA-packaging protein [Enterococcus faecium]|nr:DNA-packaging protein [Enterococcus faecium]